jgi:anti-sigma factor RsiW
VNCGDVVARLSAEIDDELSDAELLDVRRHLLSCIECARKRALLVQTRLAFRSAALDRPRVQYARAFAVSAALTVVVSLGVMVARAPIQSSPADDARQLIGIDCGRPGSTDCIVEQQPCRDNQCSGVGIAAGLR